MNLRKGWSWLLRMPRKNQTSIIAVVKSSPLFIALGVAALVVFAISFVGYARRGGFWSPAVEARVFSEDKGRRASGVRSSQVVVPFQGEVYSDADRLREASAIAIGGMLAAVNKKLDKQPLSSVESVLGEMSSTALLPPGVEIAEGNKGLSSAYANYYMRYRQEPMGVEVVSVCKGQHCGPAMLIRLPDDEFSQDALTYFTAPSVGASVPPAFAAPAEIIRAGWRPNTFKTAEVSAAEVDKGRQWLGQ
jgi:hypothetical protein